MLRTTALRTQLLIVAYAAVALSQAPQISSYQAAPFVWSSADNHSATRQTFSLNGEWGLRLQESNRLASVNVPGVYHFQGKVSFEKSFQIDSALAFRQAVLRFEGVNYDAQISLNGQVIGSHFGGDSQFFVDLGSTSLKWQGDNLLVITVDNHLTPLNSLPPKHRPQGWPVSGGIVRELAFEFLPATYIANPIIDYAIERGDRITVTSRAQIRFRANDRIGQALATKAVMEIYDSDRQLLLAASAPTTLPQQQGDLSEVALQCELRGAELWRPDNPRRYTVRISLWSATDLIDEVWRLTGFRDAHVTSGGLLLNGAPFVLRGATWIEEYGNSTALLDSAYASKMIAELKTLGINTLRIVGHPPHPLLPELCDRAGIFLLEELPLYHLTSAHYRQPAFGQVVGLLAHELIRRDRRHPSVLAWGIGAGNIPPDETMRDLFKQLVGEIKAQDSRPLYVCTIPGWIDEWLQFSDFALIDWFGKTDFEDVAAIQQRTARFVLPVIGQWLREYSMVGQDDKPISPIDAEEAQADYFSQTIPKIQKAENLSGYFIHTLCDWYGAMPAVINGPMAQLAHLPLAATQASGAGQDAQTLAWYRYPAGVIESPGKRRLAFKVIQSHHNVDIDAIQVSKQLKLSETGVFQVTGILLLLCLAYFIQRDRRLRDVLHRVFVHPHGFYLDIHENRKVSPFLTTLIGLAECLIVALLMVQICYALRQNPLFDQILNLLIESPQWKALAVWLIWHPGWFILAGTLLLYMLCLAVIALLRIVGFFSGSGLPFLQYYTFVFWVLASVLLLAVLTPIMHGLLLKPQLVKPLLALCLLIALWQIGRIFRAFRVLFLMSFLRSTIVMTVILAGLGVTILLYFNRTQALLDYLSYYWNYWKALG